MFAGVVEVFGLGFCLAVCFDFGLLFDLFDCLFWWLVGLVWFTCVASAVCLIVCEFVWLFVGGFVLESLCFEDLFVDYLVWIKDTYCLLVCLLWGLLVLGWFVVI